jgi:hypothetical protein
MNIRKLRVQGYEHTDNEDALYFEDIEIGETGHLYIGAVMDGCSRGIDSVFASHLLKKLIKEVILITPIEMFTSMYETNNMDDLSLFILEKVYKRLSVLGSLMSLMVNELESTFVLLVTSDKKRYNITFVGDGFCAIDQDIYENEQGGAPKYMAHYLNKGFKALKEDITIITGNFENEVVISSDGVSSFYDYENSEKRKELKEFFLIDNFMIKNEACFDKKIVGLKNGRVPDYPSKHIRNQDDITLIKIIDQI